MKGKKIVITAGPTREILDPVRFFSNRSSGKMGYALAEEAHQLGADVTLISGPVSLNPPIGVNVKYIENAEEMYDAVLEEFPSADIVIKSAAVADYRPKQVSNEKMKKQDGDLIIQMERTKDILKTLGERKDHQFLVGFAAETSNLDEYAMSKLKRKNADMIIANNVNEKGAGFEEDTNIVTIYKKDGSNKRLGLMSKKELAKEIFREIVKTLQEERSK